MFTCNLEEDPTQSRPALAVFCNTVPQRLFVHFIQRQPRQLNMLMSLIHSIIFIRCGRPCISKNYRVLQLKIVCLVLLHKTRPIFRLFPKITIGGERLEVKMQIRDQLVTSLSAFPPPTLACANYPRTVASRVYLPLGRGWSRFQRSGAGTSAAGGSLAVTVILRGSPLAIRWGTQCAVVWHDQPDGETVSIHAVNHKIWTRA